jgi:UDP-N-acetylmuramoyl-tripeptide--D-alanyl-D-alanine ligase
MVDRSDPFTGYSLLLRILVYGVIPAFGVWQFVRLRRAVHVFQLESYKPHWFLRWCRENRRRALFLSSFRSAKKPLVMTGRAWRMTITGTVLSLLVIYGASGLAHLAGGAPYDLITVGAIMAVVFFGAPYLLLAGDLSMWPVQKAINTRFLRSARHRLAEVAPVVVGVTGSYGKTSTKFAIEHLIGAPEEVLATPASYNTPLGISRTINGSITSSHRFLVVEMGARREGDIAEICDFVRPRLGVLTAVGPAHLESFGSLDAIRRGKYELIRSLPSDGVAVMNVDDPEVRSLADKVAELEVVRYGLEEDGAPNVTARDVSITDKGSALTIVDRRSGRSLPVSTYLLGRHALGHLLAAVAVALASGRQLEELGDPISSLEPVEHRLQIIRGTGGVVVIDDAYNSNPAGAAAALDVLKRMPGRRKVVVTPGMIELGPMQPAANREFGRLAARVADTLIVVAKVNREAIVAGASEASGADVVVVDSLDQASERLRSLVQTGDVVLFENDLPDQYEG